MSVQLVESSTEKARADDLLDPIKKRIESAKKDRGRFEPTWHSNRAAGAGKYWLKWSRADRRLKLDPADEEHGKERLTVDLLTQNLWTAMGQLAGAEQRRQLLFRREDVPSEDFTRAANEAIGYGWDHEWDAPKILAQVKRKLIIDGTCAVECYFDPTKGKSLGEVPVKGGQPIYDGEEARAYMAETEFGEREPMREINEGRICWHPRSVFQSLVPPGVQNEEDFPWEAIISAATIDSLIARYGDKAAGLKDEPMAVLEQLGLKDTIESAFGSDPEGDSGTPGKLDGYVALIRYFERPSLRHRKGRVVTYAGDRLLDVVDELPYMRPNGDYHSGIVYFHYWRVEGRFWGRGLIEPGKGIQTTYNKRLQQEGLTIDRGQPYVLAEKNSKLKQTETPLEVVEYEQAGAAPPSGVAGIPVHDGIYRSKESLKEDLQAAMGIHGVSTGEAPTRETTYAELALRAEKDRVKLDPIFEQFQAGVAVLTELSTFDIRRYWSREKVMAIAGEEGHAEAVQFEASKLPTFFLTELAETAKPRSAGADVQLIYDIKAADLEYAAATGQPPRLDVAWFNESLAAGKPLDFPDTDEDIHTKKARWENSKIQDALSVSSIPKPMEWDPPDIHVPVCREMQIEAEMAEDWDLVEKCEAHIAAHLELAEMLAELAAAEAADAEAEAMDTIAGAEQDQMAAEQEGQLQQGEVQHQQALEMEKEKQKGAKSAAPK